MNGRAIIFQRNSVGRSADREVKLARLEHTSNQTLKVTSHYLASGTPNILTIAMLIDNSLAVSRAGHIILGDLDLLWKGEGLKEAITLVARAGAVLHVVPGPAA